MTTLQKRIKFKRAKLGREGVWGDTAQYPLRIDERCRGKKELEIYVHESLHYLFPKLAEEQIERKAILLTNTLWHEGFRKIDNDNNTPLQDGTL